MAYFFSSCDWTNIDKVPLFKVKHIFLKKNLFINGYWMEQVGYYTSFQSLQKTLNNFLGHWTNDEIGVAVQSWLWVRVEIMAW